jgi:D-sedoheptulose 7-phosphate isomerase
MMFSTGFAPSRHPTTYFESLSTYMVETAKNIENGASSDLDARMDEAIRVISIALKARLPLLICGNGGSHADAQHLASELASRFLIDRPGLPVMALGSNTAILTAWSNDYEFETCFAREVEAYGCAGGVLLGISTSGNSSNVVKACEMAKTLGMRIIALTGRGGGQLAALADVLLDVPNDRTPRVQEIQICLYHYLCARVEAAFAGCVRPPPSSGESLQ